jgi:hypothetical protein
MFVVGERTPFKVRADFLVSKKGHKGIVEVKTGDKAINPASRETRGGEGLSNAGYFVVNGGKKRNYDATRAVFYSVRIAWLMGIHYLSISTFLR